MGVPKKFMAQLSLDRKLKNNLSRAAENCQSEADPPWTETPPMDAPRLTALTVGVSGIEPELQAPHARVLPLYYTPAFKAGRCYWYTTARTQTILSTESLNS